MRNTSLVLAFFVAVVWAPRPAIAADADLMSDVELTVRTYDAAGVSPSDQATALHVAAAILAGAGVDVKWMDCDTPFVRAADDPCVAPLEPTELAVRFVKLPPPRGKEGTVSLGYSLVDTTRRSGSLATLYVDRVARLAATCEVDMAVLLGRALAHEIGHLLLGDGRHAGAGLMRALWSRESIKGSPETKWQFSEAEGRQMRNGLRARRVEQLAFAAGN